MLAQHSSWVLALRPPVRERYKLFCFPYAGGGASTFRDWQHYLPEEIGIYAVRLPGRESLLHVSPITDISTLMQTLAPILLPYFSPPFAFFGHSMGALIAFEMARYIRSHDSLSPSYIVVSGSNAPQRKVPHAQKSVLHQLPDDEFIAEVQRLYENIPPYVLEDRELLELMLPALRNDLQLCEAYRYIPAPPLTCPILAMGGMQDTQITRTDLEAWQEQTTSNFQLHMFQGKHFFWEKNKAMVLSLIGKILLSSL